MTILFISNKYLKWAKLNETSLKLFILKHKRSICFTYWLSKTNAPSSVNILIYFSSLKIE